MTIVYAIKCHAGYYWGKHSNFWARLRWSPNLRHASFYPEKDQAERWCEKIQQFFCEKCVVVEICIKEKSK